MPRAKFKEIISRLQRESRGSLRIEDVPNILGISRLAAKKLLYQLSRQGWIVRLKRGRYLLLPLEAISSGQWSRDPWIIATLVYSPCYVGGWSACEYWGFTEQMFRETVVYTTQILRQRQQEILGNTLRLRAIKKTRFFGTKAVWRDEIKTLVSDPEKTIVDLLDEPTLGGGFRQVTNVLREYFKFSNRQTAKLLDYIDLYGNKAVNKRLGYLCELYFPNEQKLIAGCLKRVSKGYSKLDPSGPTKGRYLRRWALRINHEETEL